MSITVGQYFYDGDGKRVKKIVPNTGEITIFVYDAAGKLIAEYSTNVASVEDAKVAYLTADHLGSPRINTDRDGNVISRHDYHPFGEEITTSQRTEDNKYKPDTIRKQFTGYERDGETDLDFAQARMYLSPIGRFGIPDPENAGADFESPQSWNGYVYVVNNPLNMVDPNGLAYLKKGETIYWVDDKDWEDCQKQKACKEKYKDYKFVPYGTEITVAPEEKGEFYAYAGQRVTLERGRKLSPVNTSSGFEPSPLHQMLNGFDRPMTFWRPLIYAGTAVMILPAATPFAFGIGGGLASATPLGIHMTRNYIVRKIIGPVQKMLLDQFFKSGIVSSGLTVRTVMWAMEVCRTAIRDGRDTNGAQTIRLNQLQELFDKMLK